MHSRIRSDQAEVGTVVVMIDIRAGDGVGCGGSGEKRKRCKKDPVLGQKAFFFFLLLLLLLPIMLG